MRHFLIIGLIALPGAAMAQDKSRMCTDMAATISMSASTLASLMLLDHQLNERMADLHGEEAAALTNTHIALSVQVAEPVAQSLNEALEVLLAYCAP